MRATAPGGQPAGHPVPPAGHQEAATTRLDRYAPDVAYPARGVKGREDDRGPKFAFAVRRGRPVLIRKVRSARCFSRGLRGRNLATSGAAGEVVRRSRADVGPEQ